MKKLFMLISISAFAACDTETVLPEPSALSTTNMSLDFQPTMGLSVQVLEERVADNAVYFSDSGELGGSNGWWLDGESNRTWSERNGVRATWLNWAASQGTSYSVTINDRVVRSRFAVTSAFVDVDGRTWVGVNARSNADVVQHGWEVYDQDGALLFSVQRPVGETIYDAVGDQVVLLRRNPDDTFTIVVRRLTDGEDGEEVLW